MDERHENRSRNVRFLLVILYMLNVKRYLRWIFVSSAAASPESICSGDSGDTTTSLVNIEKSEKKLKTKRKLECLFPWWFVYIAWFLCGSTAITAGFFTLLFGLSFDKKLQEEWLVSMFVSIAQDIFVSQPLKVIAIAIFFALLLKKPQDEEDDTINAELARDEEWLEQTLIQTQNADVTSTNRNSQRPPDQVRSLKLLSRSLVVVKLENIQLTKQFPSKLCEDGGF